MPPYTSSSPLTAIRDQVIVLTGGAHGVGASLITTLFHLGAHVVFGDIDEPACKELVSSLRTQSQTSSTHSGSLSYLPLDVRSYASNLALFEHAFSLHSRIDHALSIAGVTEGENWFDPSLDLDTIQSPPSTSVLDINLLGALYFARIAAVYLRQGNQERTDKSLVLTGSLASFKEQPGLFVYQPAKHGVLGLFRSVRKNLSVVHGIRTNIVCPGLIDTGMAGKVKSMWDKERLPINTAEEVAGFMLDLVAGEGGKGKNGLAVYIEGGKGWELESELDRLEGEWMGEEMAGNCRRINDMLGVGEGWTKET